MAIMFCSSNLNRLLFSIVLTCFTMTYAMPLPAVQIQEGLNEIVFMMRIEKLVEKLVKSKKKGVESIIDALVDIKSEIEMAYNIKLDIGSYLDQLQKELNLQGLEIPK